MKFKQQDRIRVTDYENLYDAEVGQTGTIIWCYTHTCTCANEDPYYEVQLDSGKIIDLFESEMETE